MLYVSIFDVSGTVCGVRIEDLNVKKSTAKAGIPESAGLDIEAGFIFSAGGSVIEGLAFQWLKFRLDFDISFRQNKRLSLFWRKCHGSHCDACEYNLLCHSGVRVSLWRLRHRGLLRKDFLAEGRTWEIGRHEIRFLSDQNHSVSMVELWAKWRHLFQMPEPWNIIDSFQMSSVVSQFWFSIFPSVFWWF